MSHFPGTNELTEIILKETIFKTFSVKDRGDIDSVS